MKYDKFYFSFVIEFLYCKVKDIYAYKKKKWTWVMENNYKQKGKCGLLLIEWSDTLR